MKKENEDFWNKVENTKGLTKWGLKVRMALCLEPKMAKPLLAKAEECGMPLTDYIIMQLQSMMNDGALQDPVHKRLEFMENLLKKIYGEKTYHK
jgi:hypothetical protein